MGQLIGQTTTPWSYKNCPPATSTYCIDPTKEYPEAYSEFMTRQCTWNLYGPVGIALDADTMIEESEVDKIFADREKDKTESAAVQMA